ncbi:hypothetical protein [Rhodopirellula baltica]|jgi:hypothetical protein
MSVSLIVTTSIDREFNETDDEIDDDDWLELIESDPALNLRTEPLTATAPDGTVISMSVPDGQSELMLDDGTSIPFLALSRGELSMRYHPDMEMPTNTVRLKVAEIARYFDALITSDAGDGFLEW